MLQSRAACKKNEKEFLRDLDEKALQRRQSRSYYTWKHYTREAQQAKWMGLIDQSSAETDRLRIENDRLRRDNERFVRLIDSGEWGRGRIEELQKATPRICITLVVMDRYRQER